MRYSPQESRGTTKDRLTKNKNGRIVSKKASANAKKTEPSQSPVRAQSEPRGPLTSETQSPRSKRRIRPLSLFKCPGSVFLT